MRENLNANRKEIDLLRNDSKSLLYSLQEHQHKVFSSFCKLKETECNDTTPLSKPIDTILTKCDYLADTLNTNSVSELKKSFKGKNSSIKTVSFSDYLRTCNTSGKGLIISPRRVSKSVSPHSSATSMSRKTPAKSILKKQLVQDELSDDDGEIARKSRASSTSSMSTNSLLSLNIYGEHFNESDQDFDENLKDMFRYRDLNKMSQDSSFIDFLAKKRQAYLNHVYNSSSNLNLNKLDEQSGEKKVNVNKQTTDKKVDVSHWSRSRSADSERKSRSRSRSLSKTTVCRKVNITAADARSKSPTVAEVAAKNSSKIGAVSGAIKNRKKSPVKSKNYKKIAKQMKKNRPLLGYDWALGSLYLHLF